MADDALPLDDESFMLAGELALGVLEGDEYAIAQRRLLEERDFASAVEWWQLHLASMAEASGELQPSDDVWRGIEARISSETKGVAGIPRTTDQRSYSRLSLATFATGLGLAAAALALFIATPRTVEVVPTDITTSPSPQLVAQLQDQETGRRLASIVDVPNQRLALNITGLEAEPGQTPELWVIPEGGAPYSLGAIPGSGQFERQLSNEEEDLLRAGVTLAVTFEDDTGVRHEAPTLPILLSGPLDPV
ncbi:hypothetical protein GRI38_10470 [Altererythrobacter aurantiacus]|uniref:Anti-sigma K factor RskA C-terminal domain-containing protein n=1 Tax=Parapontixanthobacter aurantiacus TaxID=1463599 RepID=A0A844ZF96_9SPHN|nr:hypothetical protein [Parapontixanthobacter aurantiacus]